MADDDGGEGDASDGDPGDKDVQVTVEVLASGATADIVTWGDGQVLKLFREKAPHHAHEVAVAQLAHRLGVLAPAAPHGLIEIDGREAIVFERVDGPTMAQYVDGDPERALRCGEQMAAFHAAIHRCPVSEFIDMKDLIAWGLERAHDLEDDSRERVSDILADLPEGEVLVHGDFHPHNIIMAGTDEHPVAIDWAAGARGDPQADYARSWLLSRLWLQAEPEKPYWRTFWQVYLQRYQGMNVGSPAEIAKWKVVMTAASLGMDGALAFIPHAVELRLGYVEAMLDGEAHYWS